MADGQERELLLMWVRAEDGELWLEQTVDLACSDAEFVGGCRKDAYARAAEYNGQVAELRVRVPLALVFAEPPVVDAEIVR